MDAYMFIHFIKQILDLILPNMALYFILKGLIVNFHYIQYIYQTQLMIKKEIHLKIKILLYGYLNSEIIKNNYIYSLKVSPRKLNIILEIKSEHKIAIWR